MGCKLEPLVYIQFLFNFISHSP